MNDHLNIKLLNCKSFQLDINRAVQTVSEGLLFSDALVVHTK